MRTRPANRKVGRVFYRSAKKHLGQQMDTPIETSTTFTLNAVFDRIDALLELNV